MTHKPVWSSDNNIKSWGPSATRIYVDGMLGLLSVEHDGAITWAELQAIKNHWFGADACAIEVYPPKNRIVNSMPMRHLWVLGPDDWWPDLGREGPQVPRTLRSRYERECAR